MLTIAQLKKTQSDPALKENGVWHEIIVAGAAEPLKLKMRSLGSNAARTWDIARFRKQRNYYLNDGVPPIEVIDQNECDKLADVLVVEWNISTEEGAPLPVSAEAVRNFMAQLPDVRRSALEMAGRNEAYRVAEVTALAKNSEAPSTPTSDTGAVAA